MSLALGYLMTDIAVLNESEIQLPRFTVLAKRETSYMVHVQDAWESSARCLFGLSRVIENCDIVLAVVSLIVFQSK